MSSELAAVPIPAPNPIAQMEAAWPETDRKKLAQFLTIGEDDPGFIPFLAIAAELGLNPFTGEIWLIEKKSKAANAGPSDKQLVPAVGRDGLLKIARRDPGYLGYDAQVICEGDDFAVAYDAQKADPWEIQHVFRLDPERERDGRGKIVGSWCKVFLRDRRPVFYLAWASEHAQKYDSGKPKGAWSYASAMMLKVAVSYAHRLATGVSGFEPVDEMGAEEGPIEAELVEEPAAEEIVAALDIPDALKKELVESIDEANGLAPFSWGAAKLRMRLEGKDEATARQVLAEIRQQIQTDLLKPTIVEASEIEVGWKALLDIGSGEEWLKIEDLVEPEETGGPVTLILEDDASWELAPDARVKIQR